MPVGVLTSVKTDPTNGIFECLFTASATPAATAIFPGFTPRTIIMQQVVGTPDATWHTEWHDGMTSAYNVQVTSTGAGTIPTTNGFTPLVGTETSTVIGTAAAASPATAGQGFIVGTGPQAASLAYKIVATR